MSGRRSRPTAKTDRSNALEQAFDRGKRKKLAGNPRGDKSTQLLVDIVNTTVDMMRIANSNGDIERAVAELGFAYKIASLARNVRAQADILVRYALAHSRHASANADKSRIKSADINAKAAEKYLQVGDERQAAIAYTNACSAILDKSSLSVDEHARAHEYLKFSFEHKSPNTVDWAYSVFEQGRLLMTSSSASLDERIDNLGQACVHIENALSSFEAHAEPISSNGVTALATAVRLRIMAKHDARLRDAMVSNAEDLPYPAQNLMGDHPERLARTISSNPVAFGLDETPAWLQSSLDHDVDTEDIQHIDSAIARLEAMQRTPSSSDWSARRTHTWRLAQFRWLREKSAGAYSELLSALGIYDSSTDPERYFKDAIETFWSGHHWLDRTPPAASLLSAHEAFAAIVAGREGSDTVEFLKKQAGNIRFVACDLCEHGLWDEAINVLEGSRMVIFTGRAPSAYEPPSSNVTWIYIVHSPQSTFVIATDGTASARGAKLSDLNGARLIQLTHSMAYHQIGLVPAQAPQMTRHLSSAVTRALDELDPLIDKISSLNPNANGVCLIPSGLYVHLPLAAMLQAQRVLPFVVTVPARKVVNRQPVELTLSLSTQVSILTAAAPPNEPPLQYADQEAVSISAELGNTVSITQIDEVTGADVKRAVESSDILHFSGHSDADAISPFNSSLHLYDDRLPVASILQWPATSDLFLASFSSCQSAMPSSYLLGDEFIGIQSAFLYLGCRFAIGTLWPVTDSAALAFSGRFYYHLRNFGVVSVRSVSESMRLSQLWMRTATADEIVAFLEARNPQLTLPQTLIDRPQAVVFQHPRHWAAYYLSSRSL